MLCYGAEGGLKRQRGGDLHVLTCKSQVDMLLHSSWRRLLFFLMSWILWISGLTDIMLQGWQSMNKIITIIFWDFPTPREWFFFLAAPMSYSIWCHLSSQLNWCCKFTKGSDRVTNVLRNGFNRFQLDGDAVRFATVRERNFPPVHRTWTWLQQWWASPQGRPGTAGA